MYPESEFVDVKLPLHFETKPDISALLLLQHKSQEFDPIIDLPPIHLSEKDKTIKTEFCNIDNVKGNNCDNSNSENTYHRLSQFCCAICDFWTSNDETLLSYLDDPSPIHKRFLCPLCTYESDHKRHVIEHGNQMHVITSRKGNIRFNYMCDKCKCRFSNMMRLQRHLANDDCKTQIMAKKQRKFVCEVCGFATHWRGCFVRHISKHTGEKRYECELCDYRTNDSGYLRKHKLSHSAEKPFLCDTCSFRSNSLGHLKRHFITHTNTWNHQCPACDFKCNRRGNLTKHMLIHSNEKKFLCSQCEFRTNYKHCLTLHAKTHLNNRRIKCRMCKYETRSRDTMRLHVANVHHLTVDKNEDNDDDDENADDYVKSALPEEIQKKKFGCNKCTYVTNNKRSMKSHMRDHASEQTKMRCDVCNFVTSYRRVYNLHMKQHSREEGCSSKETTKKNDEISMEMTKDK